MIQLQKEEVEDMAASLIQDLYRQKYHHIRAEPSRAMTPVQSTPAEPSGSHTPMTRSQSSSVSSSQDAAATRIQAALKGSHDREQVRRMQARRLSRRYIERNHMGISLKRAVRMAVLHTDILDCV